MDAQFEHLCRICAANTKCKNNSVVESVFIFKTTGLKDKIARHLFLNVVENDPLPKVLCKSCYRQVEATASLSNIAKHTQRVFQDFLLSTAPKHSHQMNLESTVVSTPPKDICESNVTNAKRHLDNCSSQDVCESNTGNTKRNSDSNSFQPILLSHPPDSVIVQGSGNDKHYDVVIGLSNKDTEIRHQHNRRREITEYPNNHTCKSNNQTMPSRRNSVFVDSRYSSAPMSIAQRSMQLPPSLAPIHSELAFAKVTKLNQEKKNSPAGVINFIQTHGRITGSAPTVRSTEVRKGMSPSSNASKSIQASTTVSASQAVSIGGMPNLPNSIIQQKRRNLKNALNNISAIRDGQVSLLKSAHQRQSVEDLNIRPHVTTTMVPHQSLYGVESSVEEALPEHIIIAAPKKKKDDSIGPITKAPAKLQKTAATVAKASVTPYENNSTIENSPGAISKSLSILSPITDTISLGNVIRDPDLLKLILKALKWPVTAGNCDEQMAKLKSSKFAVIMSDTNLLQDNDLTQLLGPYLGPMMAIAQQQNNQASSNNNNTSPPASPLTTSDLQTIGDCTMPYKLPPETSVQLVPSSPTDQEQQHLQTSKATDPNAKRVQKKHRKRDLNVDVLSTNSDIATTSNAALVANELRNINAMLLSQFGTNPADALNEALTSMLKQQQGVKMQRTDRRRRSASVTSNPLNLEDIVLVEPQPLLETNDDVSTLPNEELPESPAITRPIIKRRKAILQNAKQNLVKSTSNIEIVPQKNDGDNSMNKQIQDIAISEVVCSIDRPQVIEASTVQNAVETPQAPSSTVPEIVPNSNINMVSEISREETTSNLTINSNPKKPPIVAERKSSVKSALGQKLLEAIGLPQSGKDALTENSRDTLRSVLKRSLKQAQEQQQQLKRVKQEEPVKQMADSTTKLVVGESSEEHKKAIAERELELLKRKTKNTDKNILPIKDEKCDRTDVSSSSPRKSRNRNKTKASAFNDDDSTLEEGKSERWDEDDDLPLKTETEKTAEKSEQFNRPTRTSKTMSKYYKCPGPNKSVSNVKSQHSMGRRSTRQR